jgi:hypothetical protein
MIAINRLFTYTFVMNLIMKTFNVCHLYSDRHCKYTKID